jgi:adenosylcobinamide-phosphate synthase
MKRRVQVLLIAVALDWLLGEPPNRLHPVAWFGSFIQTLERRVPRGNPRTELLYGAALATSGLAISTLLALALERWLDRLRVDGLRILFTAMLFKISFAWRELIRAGESVQRELEAGAEDAARFGLRALVSRETSQLDEPLLAAAAIESLAENASDSFVAPLLYYQLFGLPGAFAYRALNTLDAMIGYHGQNEFLGKVPARLDDAVNWIPARLTALLLVAASRLVQANAASAWRALRRDHARTASPNAGYPMSAAAGALEVRLEKVGHYRLNEAGRAPAPGDIRRAARLVCCAMGLGLAAGALFQWLRHD